MTRDERIEAVARAISGAPFATTASKRKAKAAILATLRSLLEPSQAMAKCGPAMWGGPFVPEGRAAQLFNAMIQQAIKEMEAP